MTNHPNRSKLSRDQITSDSDQSMNVLGVPGRLTHRTCKPGAAPELWFKQRWISEARPITGYGDGAEINAELRFDDECGNGHNSFTLTADIYSMNRGRKVEIAGGCCHDDIARIFPELASLIKWHLCASDGPMHYIANTIFHAGDRDYNGCKAGEPRLFETVIQFGANPIKHHLQKSFIEFLMKAAPHPGSARFDFEVIGLDHEDRKTYKTKYTFGGFASKWHECPFNSESAALDFLAALQTCEPRFARLPVAWGEGKARELDHARSSAIWPEATDAELSAEPEILKAALKNRLPALLADFRSAIESTGFLWEPKI